MIYGKKLTFLLQPDDVVPACTSQKKNERKKNKTQSNPHLPYANVCNCFVVSSTCVRSAVRLWAGEKMEKQLKLFSEQLWTTHRKTQFEWKEKKKEKRWQLQSEGGQNMYLHQNMNMSKSFSFCFCFFHFSFEFRNLL